MVLILIVLCLIEKKQKGTVVDEIVLEPRAVLNNLSVEIVRDENCTNVEDSSDEKIGDNHQSYGYVLHNRLDPNDFRTSS